VRKSLSTIVGTSKASIFHDTPVARRAAGLNALSEDLLNVRWSAEWILRQLENPSVEYGPLFLMTATWYASMLYARCFDSGRGRNAILKVKDVKALGRADLLSMHTTLDTYRNEIFAHQGLSSPSRAVVHLLEPIPQGKGWLVAPLEVSFDHQHSALLTDVLQAQQLRDLAIGLKRNVDVRFQDAFRELVAEVNEQGRKLTNQLVRDLGKHASAKQQAYFDKYGSNPQKPRGTMQTKA